MDKSDKTLGRRDFIRVVGGTLVATELGFAAACGDEAPTSDATPLEPTPPPATPASTTPAAAAPDTPAAPNLQPSAAGGAAPAMPPAAPPSVAPPPSSAARSGASATPPANPMTPPAAAMPSTPAMPSGGMSPDGKSRVYVIKASDRAGGIAQALTMFGGLGFAKGREVVLKPNFNSQYEFPATTHADTLKTVVAKLKEAGAGEITLADSSGATTGSSTPTATVIQAKGTVALCKEMSIKWQSYDDPSVEWETFNFDGMTWSGGLAIPKLMRSDRVKILLPCCKTHVLGDYTFSIKLAAGLPPRSRRGLISDMHTNLQEKVADINKGFTPDLIVMDATQCFIDNGPDSGTVRDPGLIVVATDRVALDAVGVAILKAAGSTTAPIRGKIFETRQIARAVKIGLGNTKSPQDIELLGNDMATLTELRSILDKG
ncbi:MAG TPA: DUF362 domain-containing protein [Polyangiales bacterium]|nr:DUF362 domain-containing protein [Polyangiales bacterium]